MKRVSVVILLIFGVVWFGCDSKSISQNQITEIHLGDPVDQMDAPAQSVFQDSNNAYWFMSDSGVFKSVGEEIVKFSVKSGLHSNQISSIQEDNAGNLYFESDQGVTKFDGKIFQKLVIKEGFEADWKLDENDMWFQIGYDNKGPYRSHGDTLYRLKFPKSSQEIEFFKLYPNAGYSPYGVYHHFKDSKNNIWFGTASMGAFRFDGSTVGGLYEDHLTHTPEGGDFGIRSIFEDSHGDFWLCNSRYRFQILSQTEDATGEVKINYTKTDGIGIQKSDREIHYPYFFSMVEDNSGDLWMAAYDEGVYRKSGDELIQYSLKEGEETVLTFSFYKDRQGGIWLTTRNFGLYRFEEDRFVKFGK
ncbi:MAG: hypothetical protein GC193_09920 [Cryomorphaceae bacterium]|nr:hypothetical protein [Cryomorphaceae bacterium]